MRGKEVSRRRSSLSRKIRQAYTLTSTYIYIYICIDRHLRWAAIILGTHLVAAFSGTLRWRRGRRWSSSLGHCHVASVVVCFLPNCVCVCLPHLAKFCPTWHSPTAHLLTTLLCLPSPPDSYSACCLLPAVSCFASVAFCLIKLWRACVYATNGTFAAAHFIFYCHFSPFCFIIFIFR